MALRQRIKDILPYVELLTAVAAAALWYRQGGAIWYTGSRFQPWPLLLLGVMWVLYLARAGFKIHIAWVDILLALFVFSAWIGTQTAYDPGPAWAKFWLVVGAWGLYYAFSHMPDQQHSYGALAFCGLFGVALTGYYFLTNNWWAEHPVKIPGLVALSEIISNTLPRLSTHSISPNVTGGMLAVVLPFYIPLINLTRKREGVLNLRHTNRRWLRLFWGLAAAWTGLGLLVTTSRGAWVAVFAGFSVWFLWWAVGMWGRHSRKTSMWPVRLWITAGVLSVVAVIGVVTITVIVTRGWPGSAALTNRLTLLQDAGLLARDCAITGTGLGTYLMNFSIYTLLIHVGYIYSSHNFLMDLLIEQGIIGLAAYLGLTIVVAGAGLRRLRKAPSALRWQIEAGMASLAVILIHGLVDDALYGSRGLLLLFIPFSIIYRGSQSEPSTAPPSPVMRRRTIRIGVFMLGIVLLMIALTWRPLLASLYASLGAVEQARVELASYDPEHFNERPMDTVRREENLDAAIAYFEQALQWDPANLTAHQRLASIDLSRGAFESALAHMVAAWDAEHRDSVTRLLYGDALLASGQIDQAASVIEGLTWAKPRLDGQAWSRYWVNEDWTRAAYAWRTLELLDPNNTNPKKSAEAAETRAAQEP